MVETEKKPEKKSFRGGAREGAGRKPGSPNKVTTEFRQTVTQLLERNSANVEQWLARVAVEDPGKAIDLLAKLAEYAAPKLARTEHVGDGGGTIQHEVDVSGLTPDQLRAIAQAKIKGE